MSNLSTGAISQLPQLLEQWQNTLGWQPDTKQQSLFQQLYTVILQGNRQLNLTRITEPAEFWEKHLWDSLSSLQPWLTVAPLNGFQVIDIGTGGGFPGVPAAIVRPDWRLTLLDSTRKKTAFLESLGQQLQLENITTLTDRAEQVGQNPQYRESFDLALIRAVANASVCAEYALPLLKVGGMAVLYRGQWTEAEAIALAAAVEQLGGTIDSVKAWITPLSQSVRHSIYLKKKAPTAAIYPRAVGVPAQKPL